MSRSENKIALGDIVALKSNPLYEGFSSVIVSGDCETLSPLMVVTEIFTHQARKGGQLIQADAEPMKSYKCIWYSHKSWQFEEAFLPEALLRKVSEISEQAFKEEDWNVGDLVVLKTLKQELSKRRSFLQYVGNDAEDIDGHSTIHHLLSFLSPVMHVLEVKKNEKKKNGLKVEFPSHITASLNLVKCKWFNAGTNKMSEVLLPPEALALVSAPNISLLKSIEEIISRNKTEENKTVYYITRKDIKSCALPLDIVYRCGQYFVRAFDYIENRVFEVQPEDLIKPIEGLVLRKAPLFDLAKADTETTFDILQNERIECIEASIKAKFYLRIKYVNNQGKTMWRTLSDFSLCILNESKESSEVQYLIGYCHSKKEERTFRVDRILRMEQLNLTFVTDSVTEELSDLEPMMLN